MTWYLIVLKKYAVFSGRARRKEYWMFFLFNILISFVLGLVTGFSSAAFGLDSLVGQTISIIYNLAIICPSIAVAIRRMHDIGRSGWWSICPVVNLVFLCLDSQPEENEYGINPKNS